MYRVILLMLVVIRAKGFQFGAVHSYDHRKCMDKKAILAKNYYTLKTNEPDIKYLRTANDTLTISNTMTFDATVNWMIVKDLCYRYYCLSIINVERVDKGYRLYKHYGWYKIFTETKNWFGAHSRCIDDGAILAVPDSAKKKQLLVDMLKESKVSQAWIGAHDIFVENYIVDSRDNVYSQHHVGPSPGKNTEDKDCLILQTNDNTDFFECAQSTFSFICQFDSE